MWQIPWVLGAADALNGCFPNFHNLWICISEKWSTKVHDVESYSGWLQTPTRTTLRIRKQLIIWRRKSLGDATALLSAYNREHWSRLQNRSSIRWINAPFSYIPTSKSGPNLGFLSILTCKCASRHSDVSFPTSQLQKKWAEHSVFGPFWLVNVLRTTAMCHFPTSQLQRVVRTWCVLCILTCQCALRHSRVPLFISHLARWLRARRFNEPTF